MDQPRALSDLMNEGHRRVSRKTPPPVWQPLSGGIAGAAAFSIPMILFADAAVGISLLALGSAPRCT